VKGKSFIIKANGRIQYIEPANGSFFSLEELKKAIGGGWIEVVFLTPDRRMVVDEEGKLKGMPVNVVASRMYNANDSIVGDALVCHRNQIK